MDRKDEIIKLQMDVINQITRNNLGKIADDLWGLQPLEDQLPNPSPATEGIFPDFKPSTDVSPLFSTDPTPVISPDPAPDIKTDTPAPIIKNQPEPARTLASDAPAAAKEAESKPEPIEDLRKELNEYIGLTSIKKEVESLINLVTVQNLRKKNQLPVEDLSLHMVFSGNPGTGKTMVARLMARIYQSLGILSKGHLVEVDRSGLVAGFVGQTAIKTTEVVKKALGGVLFIDEAYALTNHDGNDYGQEAVDTLLKAMEDYRDDLVVIVAGYIELMEAFIHSNPGLESRFNRFLDFPDYSVQEMLDIFQMRCEKSGYKLAEDANELLKSLLALFSLDVKGFGNARGVRNLFERAVSAQANRLAKLSDITREQLMLLTCDDIRVAGGADESSEDTAKEKAEEPNAEKPEELVVEESASQEDKTDEAVQTAQEYPEAIPQTAISPMSEGRDADVPVPGNAKA